MKDICNLVATYLASALELSLGSEVFYYNMPGSVDECVVVQRQHSGVHVPIQIDASVHYLRIAARAKTSDGAYALANRAYDCLSAEHDTLDEAPGFIILKDGETDISASIRLFDRPQWDSQDQQGRKVFNFDAVLITKR